MEDFEAVIEQLKKELGEDKITTTNRIPRPQQALDREMFEDFNERNPMAGGGMLVQPSADGSRPGYAGKMKWTAKEIQEIYKDLPENVYVSKRTLPSGKTDYNYRAKIRYKGKLYTFPSKVATPENKKQLIKDVEAKWDELAPNRISREEYAKLRLLPENRRLSGDEFAEKLNKVYKKVTYRGEKWNRQNVFNYDLVAPRSKKRIADDLGFFEKRTVAEAKKIINKYSGGKHFLKNKNLTDVQITTKASEYVAMEKQALKEGGKSWPRGRQNKRKVWTNIFESYKQGGRFELVNAKELADKDGTINWKKGTDKNKKNPFEPSNANWRKAKFRDKKSGAIFTYDNLEKMVDKHGGGYQKAIKAYNDNAILNQTTFNGKSLNDIIREAMIKKDYEVVVGKKVKANDPGLLKYMGDKKPLYSFTEAHHFKGVKDYPFETEPSFKRANREQGYIQTSYNKAVASGNPERIANAKKVYIEKMNKLSDEMGGIRFKMDDKTFVGKAGTTEGIVKAGLEETDLSKKQRANILNAFCEAGRIKQATGTNPDGLTCSMEEIQRGIQRETDKAKRVSKDGRIPKKFGKLRALAGTLFGTADPAIEFMFAAPFLVAGDIEGAKRQTIFGGYGFSDRDISNMSNKEAQRFLKHEKATKDWMNNYFIAEEKKQELKGLKPNTGAFELATNQLNRANENMANIADDYGTFGYSFVGKDTPLQGKVNLQKQIRGEVAQDFEKKIEKAGSTQFFKDSDPNMLDLNLRQLGGEPKQVTPITDLESYMANKGEPMAGNENFFFNVKPYVLRRAIEYGQPNLFDDYALGAGVEAPGRKSLQDAYSEIPLEYASQLAALEKKQLEEGLLKKQLDLGTGFAGGGIAGLSGGIDKGPQRRSMNPDSQGLKGLFNRAMKIEE